MAAMANQTPSGAVQRPEQFSYIEAKRADCQRLVVDTLVANNVSVSGCGFEVPSGYPTIQAAVDAAEAMGGSQSVRICNGLYGENVVINGPISLIGTGPNTILGGSLTITGDISSLGITIGSTVLNMTIVGSGTNHAILLDQIGAPNITRYTIAHCFIFCPPGVSADCIRHDTGSALYIHDCQMINEVQSALHCTAQSGSCHMFSCTTGHGPGNRTVESLHFEGLANAPHYVVDCRIFSRVYNTLPGPVYNHHVVIDGCQIYFSGNVFQLGDQFVPAAPAENEIAGGFNILNGAISFFFSNVYGLSARVPVDADHYLIDGDNTAQYIDGANNSFLGGIAGFNDRLRNAGIGLFITLTSAPTVV
jgi:hypothetical protein